MSGIQSVPDNETVMDSVADLIREALGTDGAHHKQWYLAQIAAHLGIEVPLDYDLGMPP